MTISVTEYLNYKSEKFSKNILNILPEVFRCYLMTNRPKVCASYKLNVIGSCTPNVKRVMSFNANS